jgi:hypothetical protein
MAIIKLTKSQNAFLETHLRGTGRSLSAAQAKATFGIQNLRARMTDMRNAGLVVKTETNTAGKTAYSITARDAAGKRSKVFA